jgi:hypothetical protein
MNQLLFPSASHSVSDQGNSVRLKSLTCTHDPTKFQSFHYVIHLALDYP